MTTQYSLNENFERFACGQFLKNNDFIKLGINSYNSVFSENDTAKVSGFSGDSDVGDIVKLVTL